MNITREFTVGDTLTSLYAKLYRPNGDPVVLGAAETVAFRMISTAGAVKINDQAATIVSRGSSTTNAPAEVRYDWLAADVDTAGEYVAWFIRTSAGNTEHFPPQDPDDPEFTITFWAVT
jgi:hypothetical protein